MRFLYRHRWRGLVSNESKGGQTRQRFKAAVQGGALGRRPRAKVEATRVLALAKMDWCFTGRGRRWNRRIAVGTALSLGLGRNERDLEYDMSNTYHQIDGGVLGA